MIAEALQNLAVPIEELAPLPGNPRRGDVAAVKRSLERFGQRKPVVARADGTVIAGNHLLAAARELGWSELAVTRVDDDDTTARAFALADNRTAELGTFDLADLAAMAADVFAVDPALLEAASYTAEDLEALLDGREPSMDGPGGGRAVSLAERFVVPPFSVLDARQGYWQARKAAWLSLGIESEEGRDARVYNKGAGTDPVSQKILAVSNGQSIFDPVLCELAYRWFSPDGGSVLDPFAGGSVRGIVAAWLGHPYTGIDLSGRQIAANRGQADRILGGAVGGMDRPEPRWMEGDSRQLLPDLPDASADLLFTSPPYYDLEVYSDDPRDLSAAADYEAFLDGYAKILHDATRCLRTDRFAVLVVGEVRDRAGIYHGLVPDTIAAMEDAGLRYYNEAVLATAPVTAALRAPQSFQASRKLGKTHQNVLVFYKGDPKAIKAEFGEVEVGEILEPEELAG